MSAIPWIGQDIVEFLWGGLITVEPHHSDMVLKILLNSSGKSSNLEFTYGLFLVFYTLFINVKTVKTWRKPVGVRSIHTSVASQRLNAGDLYYAYIVGLFEGDGYFSITKKGKYLTYEIGIELSIKDVQLIYKIKSLLGVGIISFREREHIKMVSLRIRDKNHLKNFIIPIFDKYPMFSKKQYDYLRFKENLLAGIIYSNELPIYQRPNIDFNTVNDILNTGYFSAWLVGFIEAEGCFSTYVIENDYTIASFYISQTNGNIIVSAIKEHLSFTPKIYIDKTNPRRGFPDGNPWRDCPQGNSYKLKVTSVRSIENIVKFLNNTPIKLLGNKRLQYILWLKKLRLTPRYKKHIPLKY